MMSQRSGQVVIEDHMYNHNHIAIKKWQPTDSLIGRRGTATGQHNTNYSSVE